MRILLFFFILALYPSILFSETTIAVSPIDQQLIKEIDVTGDGKPEKIVLHLTAKNMEAPFKWTLTIISEGKQIYSYSSDDNWFDKFFNHAGYVSGCNDYISCKKKYYYHDIFNVLVLTGSEWYDIEGILDKSQPNTLYPLGRKQLKECCNVTVQQADGYLSIIEGKLRNGKAIAINILKSPVEANSPLIFIPEVSRFISFYED